MDGQWLANEGQVEEKARARQKLCAQLWSTQKDCNCLIQLIHMNNESFREMHGHIQNADYHVRPSGDSKSQHKCWIWKEMSTIQKLRNTKKFGADALIWDQVTPH